MEVVYPWRQQHKRYLPDPLDEIGFEPGIHVLLCRGVVGHTFAWLGQPRQFRRDYERLPTSSEVLIYATCTRLPLARLP